MCYAVSGARCRLWGRDCNLVELGILAKLLRFCLIRKYSKLSWLYFDVWPTTQFLSNFVVVSFRVKLNKTQLSKRLHSYANSHNLGKNDNFNHFQPWLVALLEVRVSSGGNAHHLVVSRELLTVVAQTTTRQRECETVGWWCRTRAVYERESEKLGEIVVFWSLLKQSLWLTLIKAKLGVF